MLFYANTLKCGEFAEFLREKGVKFNDPGVNWPHMWNNVYKMLRGIVAQKALLVEFYVNCDDENDIEDSDWVIVESLLGLLKVFHSSTVRLSNARSPSAPLLLGERLLISDMLKKYKQDPFWQPVITKLQSVLLKYYKTIPPVFLCATALNPKIGVKGVENILEDIEAILMHKILGFQAFVEDLEYAFCLKGRELDEETSMGYPWWLQRRIFLKEHFNEVGWEDNGELAEDLEGECESHNYDKLSDASDEE
ncbi:zinc finger BED domain-containing protein RICESLEEPER 2-like protein [Tanacetum coccineum]